MKLGKLLVRRTGEFAPNDRHPDPAPPTEEESVEVRTKFNLEGLEPRILLSADPVLAELARVVETDNDTNSSQNSAVIVEELDADLKSDLGLGAERDENRIASTIEWPDEWQVSGAEIDDVDAESVIGNSLVEDSENDLDVGVENEIDAALEGEIDAPSDGIVVAALTSVAAADTLVAEENSTEDDATDQFATSSDDQSLTDTESEKSIDVNDDSIARAPPVYDSNQSDSNFSLSDTVTAQLSVFSHSGNNLPQQAPEGAEKERAPPVEDAQPRAPPAISDTGANDTHTNEFLPHHDGASHDQTSYLNFDGTAVTPDTQTSLTTAQLDPIFQQAIDQWSVLMPHQAALLATVTISIVDLPDKALGATTGSAIQIDTTAAGHGWFVDPTPGENSEFADPQNPPAGVDLLTAVLHEVGHVLDFDHGSGLAVMAATLATGERHLAADVFGPLSGPAVLTSLADGANLNDVIDELLGGFDTTSPPTGADAVFTSAAGEVPNSVTIGTTLLGGVDLEIEDLTLTFASLVFSGGTWDGQVGVEGMTATLFPDSLSIEVTDDGSDTSEGDDADSFAIAGLIHLGSGIESKLQLDDLNAADIGFPSFLVLLITDLELKFSDFRADDNDNKLSLGAEFRGIDTGNAVVNLLLSPANPLFGLKVEGFVRGLEFDMGLIEKGVRDLASGKVSFPTSPIVTLTGVGGSITGKLFGVGSLTATFILKEVTFDPDGPVGPDSPISAIYIAVAGKLSLGPAITGGDDGSGSGSGGGSGSGSGSGSGGDGIGAFEVAFAMSELGPLQFFLSVDVPIMIEPTTGLAISGLRAGIRFNTTIEELQTEVDFQATAGSTAPVPGGSNYRVTLTIPDHDLAIGNDLRVADAGNDAYNGQFTVVSVNGDEVTYEMDFDPLLFVGSADITRLTITDPFDLRDSGLNAGVAPPDSIFEWEAQLDQAVTNQLIAVADGDVWALLFEKITIGGGASLSFDPRIPDSVLELDVDVLIDTQLRIFVVGKMKTLFGAIEIPIRMFADLSDLFSGAGRFLYLQEVPDLPLGFDPLLVYRGEVSFETLVGNDVLNATVTENAGGGFWEVEMEIALDDPSDEYLVGDNAIVRGSNTAAFNGTYEVIGVDDATNTITLRYAADPGTWDGGSIVSNQNAVLGFRVSLEGGVDVNVPGVDADLNPITLSTLTIEGQVAIEFTVAAPGAPFDMAMELFFNALLSESNIGTLAQATGRFTATLQLPLNAGEALEVQLFGAALFTTNLGFLENIGLFANVEALLRLNTSSQAKNPITLARADGTEVDVQLPASSFAVRLDGTVDFRIDFNLNGHFATSESVFLLDGIMVMEISGAQGFNVAIFGNRGGNIVPATLSIGPAGSPLLVFDVFGFLAIRSDGIAANLILSLSVGQSGALSTVVKFNAQAVFILNTTGRTVTFDIPGGGADPNRPTGLTLTIPRAAPTNPSQVLATATIQQLIDGQAWAIPAGAPGAPYGVVFLDGSLTLLSVITLDASGFILLSPNVVSLEVNVSASGNVLNLVAGSVSGSAFFSSEGEFELKFDASVRIGPPAFNISGGAALTISLLDNNGKASGGNGILVLDISGRLTVSATVFGISLGTIGLDVGYNSNTGAITVRVGPVPVPFIARSCWSTFFGRVCIYYPSIRLKHFTFTIGSLKSVPPPAVVLAQKIAGSDVLQLNVGALAAQRNLLGSEVDEGIVIEGAGPAPAGLATTTAGQSITVTMFGQSQTFNNVTKIVIPDMGEGDDFVEILASVGVPVEVDFGEGQDTLRNASSVGVTAFGGPGDDDLEGGPGEDELFGEEGNDLLNGKAGDDMLDGGDDEDTLIGGKGADTIFGRDALDLIAGDEADLSGDENSIVLQTIASVDGGDDIIDGGPGADIIFGGSRNDIITGSTGADTITGDDGNVTLNFLEETPPIVVRVNTNFSGNDRVRWNVGDEDDDIDGQGGSDIVDIFGTDAISEQVSLNHGSTTVTAAIGAETVVFDGVETANVEGRGRNDSFTIGDLTGTALSLVNLKLGLDGFVDTVLIDGTNVDDTYLVTPVVLPMGPALRVEKQGGVTIDIFETGNGTDGITLDTGSGEDTINIRGTRPNTVTTVDGAANDDTFNVGSLAPASGGTLNQIDAQLVLNGGDHNDSLSVDDTGDPDANTGVLTAAAITGLDMTGGIAYQDFEDLDVGLGAGADTFTIVGTHLGATTLNTHDGEDIVNIRSIAALMNVNTGANDDTINVGSQAPAFGGTVNQISAPLVVNGDFGFDTLNVDDTGDTDPNTGVLTATMLTGLGMSDGIAYQQIDDLDIGLGGGADVFTISGTHLGATTLGTNTGNDAVNVRSISGLTTVNGGANDDTFNVGSLAPASGGTVNDIGAPLFVNGGTEFDTLNVDETGDPDPNSGVLTATMLTGLGMSDGITYATMDALNIDLGDAANDMTVEGTHLGTTDIDFGVSGDTVNVRGAGGPLNLDMNLGNDNVNFGSLMPVLGGLLDAIDGPVEVDGGGGIEVMTVDDSGDTQPNVGTITASTITGLGMAQGIAYSNMEFLGVTLGSGADTLTVSGTMRGTDGFQRLTHVMTGAGRDTVDLALTDGVDGFFVLNTGAGNDTVNGETSTLPLIIAGGDDDDEITGGAANDILFGDRGLVTYYDDPAQAVGVYAGVVSGPFIDGIARLPKALNSVDPAVGGDDMLAGNGGDDFLIGGAGSDTIYGGAGKDLAFGDNGRATFAGTETFDAGEESAILSFNFNASSGRRTVTGTAGAPGARAGNWNNLVGDGPTVYGDDTGEFIVFDDGSLAAGVTIEWGEDLDTDPDDLRTDSHSQIFPLDDDQRLFEGYLYTSRSHTLGVNVAGLARYFETYDLYVYLDADNGKSKSGESIRAITDGTRTFYLDDADGNTFAGTYIEVTSEDQDTAQAGNYVVFRDLSADVTSIRIDDYTDSSYNKPAITALQVVGQSRAIDRIESTGPGIGGNDTIRTGANADIAIGGPGDDDIDTGDGADIALGDSGRATLVDGELRSIQTVAPDTGGNDTIRTGLGEDLVLGGAGDDDVVTNSGTDTDHAVGDNGSAIFLGGAVVVIESTDPAHGGNDTIDAGDGNDNVIGGRGDDILLGGAGNDLLLGDNARLVLLNGGRSVELLHDLVGGDDTLEGGPDDDLLYGQFGNDTYVFAGLGLGRDQIIEAGDGDPAGRPNDLHDRLDFSAFGAPIVISLASTREWRLGGYAWWQPPELRLRFGSSTAIEDVTGSAFNDVIVGNMRNNALQGRNGHDLLDGQSGDDVLTGGMGDDLLIGGDDEDVLDGGAGDDILIGDSAGDDDGPFDDDGLRYLGDKPNFFKLLDDDDGFPFGDDDDDDDDDGRPGADVILGGPGDDAIAAGGGDDLVDGGAGNDRIGGGRGNDILIGGDGADVIRGSRGDDLIEGGPGIDDLRGESGFDRVTQETGPDPLGLAAWFASFATEFNFEGFSFDDPTGGDPMADDRPPQLWIDAFLLDFLG